MHNENFREAENLSLGRYLVSEKEFQRGDIVWEEAPLLSAPLEITYLPSQEFPFTCVTCFIKVSEKTKCGRCGWPCCSEVCSENEIHRNYECVVLKKNNIAVTSTTFENILFIRFLEYKTKKCNEYEKLLNLCSEYPPDVDVRLLKYVAEEALTAWKFITAECKLDVPISEVNRMLQISMLNSYNFHLGLLDYLVEYEGQCLYDKSSLFSNSCSPNLEYSFFKTSGENGGILWNIRFHARQSIRKGDLLTIAYARPFPLLGTIPRQLKIRKLYHFTCKCSHCLDKTEGSTYFSAVLCTNCKKGYLLPINPIHAKVTPWSCSHCKYEKTAYLMKRMTDQLGRRVLSLKEMNLPTEESLTFADEFIEKNSGSTLHENHYLLFQCGVFWLMNGDFLPTLCGPPKESRKLFCKIMKRVRIFFPIASNLWASDRNAPFHCMMADVLATYFFLSKDLKTTQREEFLPSKNFRFSRRILFHLNESLGWFNMTSICTNNQKYVKARLEHFIGIWSRYTEMYAAQNIVLQETALNSVATIFNIDL